MSSQRSSSFYVSLATSPFILGLLAAQAVNKTLIELGQSTEEVFRGDRLPILNVPSPENQPQQHDPEANF